MIERGIGTAVAKSPMLIASGGPASVASYFMRVSGIASRCCSCLLEMHTDSHHSYVGGYGLIHDFDPVSKGDPKGIKHWCIAIGQNMVSGFKTWRAKRG